MQSKPIATASESHGQDFGKMVPPFINYLIEVLAELF